MNIFFKYPIINFLYFSKYILGKEKAVKENDHEKDTNKHDEKQQKHSSSKSDKKRHQEPMDVDSDSKNVILN